MYEIAKKARESLKSKAKRIAAGEPGAKVDSSSYEPPKDALNADVKTGLRPVSRRAFKSGGKVQGAKPKANLGVTPRSYANAKINRNVKDANEDREGIKHVGGMKKGGRAGYKTDGKVRSDRPVPAETLNKITDPIYRSNLERSPSRTLEQRGNAPDASDLYDAEQLKRLERGYKKGGRTKREDGGRSPTLRRDQVDAFMKNEDLGDASKMGVLERLGKGAKYAGKALVEPVARAGANVMDSMGLKKGGRAKKNMGGPMMGDPRMSMVKDKAMEFAGNPVTPGLKNGGKAKHPDEAMDKALIKKMVKPEARMGKAHGGMKRMNRKEGGGVFSGAGYPEKIPGVVPGGRTARKDGGRAKGKTDINIIISTGKGGQQPDGMMAPPPGAPPPGLPVPVPGGPQGGPPPMPMAAPPAPPPQMPPQMPPMARKRGGRASYKDMTAGAGSGEGRLQKTEIQANKRPERKAGGKVYRSYKDMDAGSGSGLGRLEKTEIQSRKH